MEKLSRFVLGHKRLVIAVAFLASALGLAAAAMTVPRLATDYSHPGIPAYETNQRILDTYGNGGYQRPFVPVITLPSGQTVDDVDVRAAIGRAFAAVVESHDARVVSYADTGDRGFVGDDGRTTFGYIFPGPYADGSPPGGGLGEVPDESPALVEAMRGELPAGTRLRITGLDTLAPGSDAGGLNIPLEILVGVLGAVAVLLLVFRSALAFVPLLIAVTSVSASFVLLLGLTAVTQIHEVAMRIMPLLGLGIAIDYSLLLVTRWREEQARGHGGDDAVHRAMSTAGHSIIFSGAAVAIGLVTMMVLPVPFLRSLGLGGMIVAAASAATTLTILPVVLASAGRRLDRRRLTGRAVADREARVGRGWSAWARGVVRFRWPVALTTSGLLVVLGVIGLGANLGLPESANLLKTGPGYAGLRELAEAGIPSGALTPIDVLVPAGTDPDRLADDLAAADGVLAAAAPDTETWRRGGTALISVIPRAEGGSAEGVATISALRDAVPAGTEVGGNAAQSLDFVSETYAAFPVLLALIALVTFVMLARAFRSLLLALKAVVVNLLSLGAVMGAMVIIWQWGFGSQQLLGIQATGSIGEFIPLTIFAFLYGLSMDYEVFVLARMREEYDRTGSTAEAVVTGIGRTGRLVTCAALILFLSFATMAATPEFDVKVFASGLGLGILLDATLVRALLVPAVVATMGRWNWWLPNWAARILRVRSS